MDKDTFTRSVKEELSRAAVKGHSQAYWEAFALRRYLPARSRDARDGSVPAEPFLIRRLYHLMKQGSGVEPSIARVAQGGRARPRGRIATKPVSVSGTKEHREPPLHMLRRSQQCRRGFLRGVFLARGSVASPSRSHHLEMAMPQRKDALLVQSLMAAEELRSGLVQRRSSWVVYLKDGDEISEFLKIAGAMSAVLEYEGVRARKSLKSSVQRLVNMDRANVGRAVEASLRQLDDIRIIDEELGLHHLPPALKEVARLRQENPDLSMEELGEILGAPASKSAVNHRFRRLAALAGEIRGEMEKGERP